MVVLCRSRLELQQHAISTKVGRKLKMLTKQHFRNGIKGAPADLPRLMSDLGLAMEMISAAATAGIEKTAAPALR